jgi:hypothetical protein
MGCTTCKKKKPVTKLEPVIEEVITFDPQQVKLAYDLLSGIKLEERPFVNEVYKSIFNEDFDWECKVCVNTQARKLKSYIENELKLKV